MSQVPIPPRDSSRAFGEKMAQKKEAEKTRREAQKSTETLASWESVEYWDCRKRASDASLVINEIDREVAEEKGEEGGRINYLQRKVEFEEESETAARKIRRYKARERIMEAATTKNSASMRASYLELMMSLLSKISRANQDAFVIDLKNQYGSKVISKNDFVWNTVTGTWRYRADMTAAHLFPLSFGQATMTYIFGKDAEDEINKAANGLFLPGVIEHALARHKIAIVPCEGETDPQEWKWIVLDQGGQWYVPLEVLSETSTFADLHQRKLIFQPGNSFRPRARYLYFHYAMAILRTERGKNTATAGRGQYMPESTTPAIDQVWATPGRYLRESMTRAFIEGIGHEDPNDGGAEEMLSHAMEDLPNEMAKMLEDANEMKVESDQEEESDGEW